MAAKKEYPFTILLLRSMMPSGISIAIQLCVAIAIIVLHFLLLGMSQGAFLPSLLEGEWAAFFSNAIVRPLLLAVNNELVANLLIAFIWGLLGFMIYAIIESTVRSIRDFRDTKTEVQMTSEAHYLKHPLVRRSILVMLWRIGIGMAAVGVTIGLHGLVHRLLVSDQSIYEGEMSFMTALQSIAVNIASWMLIMHIYLVLMRLYVLRTKLFGEILY